MSQESRFIFRFMQPGEAGRLAELIENLQLLQKLAGVDKVPTRDDILNNLFHTDAFGKLISHNKGTFTAFVIDTTILEDDSQKSNIVGYLVYSLKFTLAYGRQFYINSFFIEEPYRRHGLGRKLVKFMQTHGKLLGINRFDVPFMKTNIAGQKFYKSFGAQLVDCDYNLFALPIESRANPY